MADNDNIFKKMLQASSAVLDAQIAKAKNTIEHSGIVDMEKANPDFNFGKAITKDNSIYIGAQGFDEKPGAVGFEFNRQMAMRSSIISAIIKTRQSQVISYSEAVADTHRKGFRLVLKDEKGLLKQIREELFPGDSEGAADAYEGDQDEEARSASQSDELGKADMPPPVDGEAPTEQPEGQEVDPMALDAIDQQVPDQALGSEGPITEFEKDRIAREELEKRMGKKRQALTEFLTTCGELKDRPFEDRKWNFSNFLKAVTWDSLAYDQLAVEFVPKTFVLDPEKESDIHHFRPIDGSTVRYANTQLGTFKDRDMAYEGNILFPDEEKAALEASDALVLDDERLATNAYKYVQLIRGRIQRAFTEKELALGIRNPMTDIYMNGYGLSELELLTSLVTSHLHAEYYNKAYYINGFSAKGILHVKANLNRAKLEELRRHWQHMVKGNRNSFQTPIMSGMDEVKWIPLTQSHSDMEFSLWMNYLIKMICAIYQIDPSEIGYGMKDEGGAGMSGDNTAEKLGQSKDKGFIPFMTFLASFINTNIVDRIDPDFKLEWVGLHEESLKDILERQASEVKFKKTVNEIRAEDGLPPIDGADNLILDAVYFQWYSQFSTEGKAAAQKQQDQMAQQQAAMNPGGPPQQPGQPPQEGAPVEKALKIEYFRT